MRISVRILTTALVFLTFCFYTHAQEKSKYNLLWEISGNGLKKPSYLFGSIHLKDKRAFNFSDSVMKAITSTTAFALEIHPDSMIKSMFEKFADGEEAPKPLLKNDYSKDDDMQTFIDAYLYGIARTNKKKILGLEDATTQMDLLYGENGFGLDDLSGVDGEEERKVMEEMIDVYSRGNINEIWVFLKKMDMQQLGLKERNAVMCKSISDIIKTETLFAVVGAAHLPGEDGIIRMLTEQGYQLRPVEATFTGGAASYKIDYAKMDWYKYKNEKDNYSIDFPSLPFIATQQNPTVVAFPDIINDAVYTVTSLYTGPIVNGSIRAYLEGVVKTYLSKDSAVLLEEKTLTRDGLDITECLIQKNGKFNRVQLMFKNEILYVAAVEHEKNILYSNFADRFFNSLKVTDAVAGQKRDWVNYNHKVGAFSVSLPTEPEIVDKDAPNLEFPDYPGYVLHLFSSVDRANQVNYLIRYNDFPNGLYLMDKSSIFESSIKILATKGTIVDQPKTIYKGGIEGKTVGLLVQGMHMEVQIFVRGNRTYLLLRHNMSGSTALKTDRFFDSFKFEPYGLTKSIPLTVRRAIVDMPDESIPSGENDDASFLTNSKSFFAVNPNSGGVHAMETAEISKYFKISSVDSLYRMISERLITEVDSVYDQKDVLTGTIKGKQWRSFSRAAGTVKQVRLWIDQEGYYSRTFIGSEEELNSKEMADIFANIRYEASNKPFDLASSKANLLINDLKNADTLVSKKAYGALSFYKFSKDELPLVHLGLKHYYPNDTLENGSRERLMRELSGLKDKSSVVVLKELVKDKKNSDLIRSGALSKITLIDKDSYDWYLNTLISNSSMKLDNYWNLFRPLTDSVAYCVSHIEQFAKLADQKNYRPQILNIMSQILEGKDKPGYSASLEAIKGRVAANAVNDLDGEIKRTGTDKNINYSLIYAYLDVIPRMNMKEVTDEFTSRLLAADSLTYLKSAAVAARIISGLKVDADLLSAQLDSLSTRFEIMNAFRKADRLSAVPEKYRKHDEFAKLLLYNYLGEEYSYPEAISLLGEVKADDGLYYAFEFSYTDEDGKKLSYLGICGAFGPDKDKLEFDKYSCHSKFEEKTADWINQAKALIGELK